MTTAAEWRLLTVAGASLTASAPLGAPTAGHNSEFVVMSPSSVLGAWRNNNGAFSQVRIVHNQKAAAIVTKRQQVYAWPASGAYAVGFPIIETGENPAAVRGGLFDFVVLTNRRALMRWAYDNTTKLAAGATPTLGVRLVLVDVPPFGCEFSVGQRVLCLPIQDGHDWAVLCA